MKKRGLLILSAVALVSLAGCNSGGTPDTEEVRHVDAADRFEEYESEELDMDTNFIIAYEDEGVKDGHQISLRVLPIKAHDTEIVYSSKNPEVAKVSESGLVQGVSAGETTIVAMPKDKPEQAKEVPVVVLKDATADEVKPLLEEQRAIQKANYIEKKSGSEFIYVPTKFRTYQHLDHYFYTIDDPTVAKDKQTRTRIRGYSENEIDEGDSVEGYYGLTSKNYSLAVEDGAVEFTNYGWLFHTDDTYETYIYHILGSIKNVLSVPSQGYIGKERLAPAYDAMGLMFSNLREIAEGNFEQALSTDALGDVENYSSLIVRMGYNDQGYVSYRLEQLGYSNNTYVDPEDESTWTIPAGTHYVSDVMLEYIWKDGVAVGWNYLSEMTYTDERDPYYIEPDGSIRVDAYGNPIEKKYVRQQLINQKTEAGEDVEINLPSPKGFNPVAELWDL